MERTDIGPLIKDIHDKIKIDADANLKKNNLTLSQSRVIIFLKDHGNKATQKEIERFLDVSHPTVVGLISRLEKNGFVKSYGDGNDKRQKVVSLTQMAIETSDEMDDVISKQEAKMLAGLSDEEILQLIGFLKKIDSNLK